MTAATTSVMTPSRELGLIFVLLAASAVALEGTLAFVDTDGYGSSTPSTGCKCVGVWESGADNSTGLDGASGANVRHNRQFLMLNDSTNPVTQAHLFADVYALDNQTVSSSSNSNARAKVGRFMGFDKSNSSALWVEIL
jgi:hypothetical protein